MDLRLYVLNKTSKVLIHFDKKLELHFVASYEKLKNTIQVLMSCI